MPFVENLTDTQPAEPGLPHSLLFNVFNLHVHVYTVHNQRKVVFELYFSASHEIIFSVRLTI